MIRRNAVMYVKLNMLILSSTVHLGDLPGSDRGTINNKHVNNRSDLGQVTPGSTLHGQQARLFISSPQEPEQSLGYSNRELRTLQVAGWKVDCKHKSGSRMPVIEQQ